MPATTKKQSKPKFSIVNIMLSLVGAFSESRKSAIKRREKVNVKQFWRKTLYGKCFKLCDSRQGRRMTSGLREWRQH